MSGSVKPLIPADILGNWLLVLRRDKAIESMQEKLQNNFDQSYDPTTPHKLSPSYEGSDVKTFDGTTTSEGIPHGHGRMTFTNGQEFEGEFIDGRRKGYGKLVSQNQEARGYFHNDLLIGSVTRVTTSKHRLIDLSITLIGSNLEKEYSF